MTSPLDALKDKGTGSADAPEADAKKEAPEAKKEATGSGKKEYQQYQSARVSTCLVTPAGQRINFTNYNFYTKDADTIAYLDGAIEKGMRAISKGEKLSADEINPAAAAKRKIIEDFKASQEGRDFSGVGQKEALAAAGKTGGVGTGMVGTGQVAN